MKAIIEGNSRDIQRIINENRLRVSRGLVSFDIQDDETSPKRGKKKKEPIIDGKPEVKTDNKGL